jgi:hypothetical protein
VKPRKSPLLAVSIEELERTTDAPASAPVSDAAGKRKAIPTTSRHEQLPQAAPTGKFDPSLNSRAGRLALVKDQQMQLADLAQELKYAGGDLQRKASIFRGLNDLQAEVQHLQRMLTEDFVPQHSPSQLISPQDLLVSRLFNVRNKTVQREALVKFDLMRSGSDVVSYSGPELRQPDGFTFMALVNLARDFRVGTAVAFEPSVLCNALVGYYDTRSRLQLKESIKRLMQAVITFPDFSVQLAQKFLHPARGMWSVALDPQLVRLFGASNYIWLDLQLRRELTEGLATWLYGYIRGQSYLNPTRLELLHEASGSDAKSVAAFQRSLYPALRELTARGVLEPGARVDDGVLHWRRATRAQGT